MTRIMSYNEAVLEIREEVANRDHFIISGNPGDMASALDSMKGRKCTIWINADFSEHGVFKVDSTEVNVSGMTAMIAMVTNLFSMEVGVVASVPKGEGLPEKFEKRGADKDLLCLNSNLPVMAAEAMRTLWPDSSVLPPEDTIKVMER